MREQPKQIERTVSETLVDDDPNLTTQKAWKEILSYRQQMTSCALSISEKLALLAGREKLDIDAFIESCGIDKEDAKVFKQLATLLTEDEFSLLRDQRVTFRTLADLVAADAVTRRYALESIARGHNYNTAGLSQTAVRLRRNAMSFENRLADASDEAFTSAYRKNLDHKQSAFREHARHLYSLMLVFDRHSRFLTAKPGRVFRADRRTSYERFNDLYELVVDAARKLLPEFESVFGSVWPEIGQWAALKRKDPVKEYLAQAHYSLRALSAEEFQYVLPMGIGTTYRWSSLTAVKFLAALREENQGNPIPWLRPEIISKLKAVDLLSDSGVHARGVKQAAFEYLKVGYTTTPSKATGPYGDVVGANDGTRIDLVTAALPKSLYTTRGEGAPPDKVGLLSSARAIDFIKPRAFFFECDIGFLTKRHVDERRLFIKQLQAAGYAIVVWELSAEDFGLWQKRDRCYIVGIEHQYVEALRPPMSLQRTNAKTALLDVAFSRLSVQGRNRILGLPVQQEEMTPDQEKYDRWAELWFIGYGTTLAPDVNSNPAGKWANSKSEWAKSGFSLETGPASAMTVGDDRLSDWTPPSKLDPARIRRDIPHVPITVDILRRLQGIPTDWAIPEKEIVELSDAQSPVMSNVVARSIHAALSGEAIDLTDPSNIILSGIEAEDKYADKRSDGSAFRWMAERWALEMSLLDDDYEASRYRHWIHNVLSKLDDLSSAWIDEDDDALEDSDFDFRDDPGLNDHVNSTHKIRFR